MIFIEKLLGQRAPFNDPCVFDGARIFYMNVAMKIKELKTEERSDSLIAESVNLWEGSVKATHLFLT